MDRQPLRAGVLDPPGLRYRDWTHLIGTRPRLIALQLAFFDPTTAPIGRAHTSFGPVSGLPRSDNRRRASRLNPCIRGCVVPWRLGQSGLACIDGDEGRLLRPGEGGGGQATIWLGP